MPGLALDGAVVALDALMGGPAALDAAFQPEIPHHLGKAGLVGPHLVAATDELLGRQPPVLRQRHDEGRQVRGGLVEGSPVDQQESQAVMRIGVPIGDTSDNLKAAIAGETHEYTDMYPGMAKSAREEGFAEIADWFETLAKAEKSHAGRFAQMLKTIS